MAPFTKNVAATGHRQTGFGSVLSASSSPFFMIHDWKQDFQDQRCLTADTEDPVGKMLELFRGSLPSKEM